MEKLPGNKKPEVTEPKKAVTMTGETVIAPIEGTIVDLSKVPDQVFSQKMVGDGFAIIPAKGK